MRERVEVSCGAVVYTRRNGQLLFLLIQSLKGIWGFPKGHMEAGETETQTALREVLEETGVQVRLMPEFREEDAYPLGRTGTVERTKRVVYFLGSFGEQAHHRQETEVAQIRLVPPEHAMELLSFPSTRRIFAFALEHIRNMDSVTEQPELL